MAGMGSQQTCRLMAGAITLALVLGAVGLVAATPARAGLPSDTQNAAQVAIGQGYRTGVAVLDLKTGAYTGAGDDTGPFASESVAKVLIAIQLLLTGQMTGATASTAYEMITESDDDDADALYGLAGGDELVTVVAAHYGITDVGNPPASPGWWGNTEITAKGITQLYAAIAKDPTVGPWLLNAMAHATVYGADGTYQFFGIPSATTGAAVKQGWGDDGDDSPNAVFDTTGYVASGRYAVAILTDGPPDTYGATISDVVTAQAKALMPTGTIDDPAQHNPTLGGVRAVSIGSTVRISGTAHDPDSAAPLAVTVTDAGHTIAAGTTGAGGGFVIPFPASDGHHSYLVTAHNVGEGTGDATTTTAVVHVDGDPSGTVTSVSADVGQIRITGTETDPNLTAGQTPRLTVSVDDQAAVTTPATPSGGSDAVSGTYDIAVPASPGTHRVTVTYLATGDGTRVTEGTWTAVVAAPPRQEPRISVAGFDLVSVLVLALGGVLIAVAHRRRHSRRPVRD